MTDATATPPTATTPVPTPTVPLWLRVVFVVVFGLLLAYDVWEVLGSILQLLSLGLGFTATGWVIMIVALIAPLVLFACAFLIARRRGILISLLAYATAVAVSAVLFSTATVLLNAVGAVVVP